jgi:hypothetical protein
MEGVFDLLSRKGVNVERNARIRGLSGVFHEFDAVIDGKIGVIVVEGISPEDSVRIALKKIDTGLKIVVISPDPLPKEEKYILEEMGVEVVEGRDWERVADSIMLVLGRS